MFQDAISEDILPKCTESLMVWSHVCMSYDIVEEIFTQRSTQPGRDTVSPCPDKTGSIHKKKPAQFK